MNSILSTRCPGRRLTNEITNEWSEVKQEEKNKNYYGTQNNIITFFMFFENLTNPIEINLKFNNTQYHLNRHKYLLVRQNILIFLYYLHLGLLPKKFGVINALVVILSFAE